MERRGPGEGNRAPDHWSIPSPWFLLNSMGFTIGVLVVLVIASAVGVIVPQGAPEQAYIHKYGAVLGRIVTVLGIDDLFRVWWYVALWVVVVAGLLVCSINRLPFIFRSAFGRPLLTNPADFKTYAMNESFRCAAPPEKALSAAKALLKRKGFRLHEGGRVASGMLAILAHKGGMEKFGPFVTHMSIVVVLAGGMMDSSVSSTHDQPAYGGQTFEVPDLSFKESLGYQTDRLLGRMSEDERLHQEMEFMDWRRLPNVPERRISFSVRVDSFRIETTPEGGVADYKTTATVFDPDSLFTFVIEVNKPLVHKGYHFYQSSYGYSSRTVEDVKLLVTDKSGAPVGGVITLPFSVPVEVPGTGMTLVATDFAADFVYDIETRTGSSRSEEHRNPAVRIEVYRDGVKQFDQWLMLREMAAHASKDENFDFRVVGYDPEMYTVLEVRTHPLMNVVWIGFGMAVVGVFLSFYVTQRRVWVGVLERAEGTSEVLMAAASRRGRRSFNAELKAMAEELRGRFK
jgi:cytochrome c biogenesis protein